MCGRGGIVDQDALYEALSTKRIWVCVRLRAYIATTWLTGSRAGRDLA